MTITINLDPETEKVLARKAARLNISVSEYMERLAKRSVLSSVKKTVKPVESPEQRLQSIINRADPAELSSIGLTLPAKPYKNGAELLANLRSAGVLTGFGDPNIDSLELARQLRKQAETRDWS
jgi:hypothetical protein